MLKLLLLLLTLALRGAIYVVIASAVLGSIRAFLRPRWTEHAAVRTVIAVGEAFCTPARVLLEAVGISPRPFDFSAVLTTAVLEILVALLSLFLR